MIPLVSVFSLVALTLGYLWRNAHLTLKLKFLFRGRELIEDLSIQNHGSPYCLPIFGFGGRMHVVSSKEHFNEIAKAPDDVLSGHVWGNIQVQSRIALGVPSVSLGERKAEGSPVSSAIRTSWNRYLDLQPRFLAVVKEELVNAVANAPTSQDGYAEIRLCRTVNVIVARLNTLWTLGEELANDTTFIERGLAYSNEAKIISELAKLFPSYLITPMARLVKYPSGNQSYVLKRMEEQITQKWEYFKTGYHSSGRRATILEALLDRSPTYWTMREFIRDINTSWNTANATSPIVAVQLIQDLCRHAQYIPALREEALTFNGTQDLKVLSLLEGFLTESIRTQCVQATNIHRMARQDFTLDDGYTIPARESVQFNLRAIFHNEDLYPEAHTFNPERHRDRRLRSTDVRPDWPFWGAPRMPCPGRFFAVTVAKLIAIYLLEDWDFKLKDGDGLSFGWRDVSVPNPSAKLLIKKRELEKV